MKIRMFLLFMTFSLIRLYAADGGIVLSAGYSYDPYTGIRYIVPNIATSTSSNQDTAAEPTNQLDIIAELKEKYINMLNLSRKTMNEKRTEINYEMMKDDPNWEKVESLSKEMNNLEKEVAARTEEYKRAIEKFNPSMNNNEDDNFIN